MKVRMERGLTERKISRRVSSHHHSAVTEPAVSEISVFEKHLQRIKKGKGELRILIIGSSPELRDLTARNNIRTTVVANDLDVIERTSKLMKNINDKEHWLEGNISKLPLKKNTFDAVFGDHIISNASPFNSSTFYSKLKEIVKKNGFLVFRSVVFSKTEKPFERKISKYFRIVEKEFGKQGMFAHHFPIYFARPRQG